MKKWLKKLLFFSFALLSFISNAQAKNSLPTDTATANIYLKKADSFLEKRDFDSSLYYYSKSKALFAAHQIHDKSIEAYIGMIINSRYLDKLEQKEALTREALQVAQTKLDTPHVLCCK